MFFFWFRLLKHMNLNLREIPEIAKKIYRYFRNIINVYFELFVTGLENGKY